MSAEKATAIVIRTVEFSESSLIVTLFSREFGKIEGIAKGARRIKGPFMNALDLLAQIRVVFLRKTSGALDILTEARLEDRFRPCPANLQGLYGGYYMAELLNALTPLYEPIEPLYDQTCEILQRLATDVSVPLWATRFEAVMLNILGYMPSLDLCVECGVPAPESGRVAFGHLDGGLLCQKCRAGKTNITLVDVRVLKLIGRMADPDDLSWEDEPRSANFMNQMRGLMGHHVCHLLGRKPRLLQYVARDRL